jgi:hypothetical protein
MSEQTYQPSGLTHEIKTIEQFADLVTEENLPLIVEDFRSTLEALVNMDKLVKQVCEIEQLPYEKLKMEAFNWIDDGKHELSKITIQSSEDPSVKIEITQKGESE